MFWIDAYWIVAFVTYHHPGWYWPKMKLPRVSVGVISNSSFGGKESVISPFVLSFTDDTAPCAIPFPAIFCFTDPLPENYRKWSNRLCHSPDAFRCDETAIEMIQDIGTRRFSKFV